MDWAFVVVAFMNLGFVLGLLLNLGGILTWVERKQAAVMANRIGANRAWRGGYRHPPENVEALPAALDLLVAEIDARLFQT